MRTLSRLLLIVVMIGATGVIAAAWRIASSASQPSSQAGIVIEDVMLLARNLQVLEDTLVAAETLAQIDPQTRIEQINVSRARADYQRELCERHLETSPLTVLPMVPLRESSDLLREAKRLLGMAMAGSPTKPVSEHQAAQAPVLSTDPDQTGVLPGVRELITTRVDELRAQAMTLEREAQQSIQAHPEDLSVLAGLTVTQWLLVLAISGATATLLISLWALVRLALTPDSAIEKRIQAAARRNPSSGIELCYERVERMLDLADRLAKQGLV